MKRVITINSNDLEKSLYTKELLTKKLEENNFLVSSKLEENTELIISIGGDGSFLKTIQDFKFPSVPMVVINTGHLGFFAEFDPDEIDEFIELYKNNDFTIQEVHPLKGSICTKESSKDIYAVNEIVIKSVCSRTLHLDLRVNENKIQNFSGDGMSYINTYWIYCIQLLSRWKYYRSKFRYITAYTTCTNEYYCI